MVVEVTVWGFAFGRDFMHFRLANVQKFFNVQMLNLALQPA
jgi:hypothetical protein